MHYEDLHIYTKEWLRLQIIKFFFALLVAAIVKLFIKYPAELATMFISVLCSHNIQSAYHVTNGNGLL